MRVSVQNVSKSFQGREEVLHSISIEIENSTFLSLIGPSGTGKTTLLKIIAGLERPTHGKVYFDGKDVTFLPPQNRRIGFAFQVATMFPHLSIRDNILLAMKTRGGVAQPEQRLSYLLKLFGVEHIAGSLPGKVSGGEARRASLAQMLSYEPSLLLLDEPFSNLDRPLVRELSDMLREWHRASRATVIQVTHDVSAAWRLSDKVAILLGGRIQQHGTPREVYQRPCSRTVADFCGQMNWIRGTDLIQFDINNRLDSACSSDVFGVRPSAIELSAAKPNSHSWIVRDTRFAGDHLDVDIANNHNVLHVMTPVAMSDILTPGASVRITINLEDLISFGPQET